jgi:hypothetical protein
MTAQNQHYVPRFILRQFLCDAEKEQVAVYDKHGDKTFITAIKNIMAEHRFHDFVIEEVEASFEPIATKIEQIVLPVYRKVLETRRLDRNAESQAALALLIAFQLLRTKAQRGMWTALEAQIQTKVEAMGGRMENIEGWEEPTENVRTREHLRGLVNSIDEFTAIIAQKDFLLANAMPGRSFYLGDHPVGLYNQNDFSPYGNLGLAVRGIQIYMPLSADLLLCSWCPSVLADLSKRRADLQAEFEREALAEVMAGRMAVGQMRAYHEQIRPLFAETDGLLQNFQDGAPITSTSDNMDHYNSIQCSFAYRYVIAKDANFDIARRHNHEFPKFRKGHQPMMS